MRVPSAPALWGLVVGAVLAADAVLVSQGKETMSEWYARHPIPLALLAGYLLMHLHGHPRRFSQVDPLHLLAQVIRGRRVVVVLNGT